MALRTGRVIFAKGIKLDRNYKNIIDYTETQMVNLVSSKKVAEFTNCSFLRPGGNSIKVDLEYGQAIQCNYLAFENPDYSNKWFFAFIDSVNYISNGTSEIIFTIDELSTWRDYWVPAPCFVVREHVNDDTIGIHTVPESLELGEMIQNSSTNFEPDKDVWTSGRTEQLFNKYMIVFQVTELPAGSYGISNPHQYNSVYSGLFFVGVKSPEDATLLIHKYDQEAKHDSIVAIFMAPTAFFDGCQFSNISTNLGNVTVYYPDIENDATILNDNNYTISRPNSLNGYQPKNAKLFCYPYSYITVDNNAGACVVERYEDFVNNVPAYVMAGALGQGCSIKLLPLGYKGTSANVENYNEGINANKLPICGWTSDYYTNWLTQNALNIPLTFATDAVGTAGSLVGSLVGALASGKPKSGENKSGKIVSGVVGGVAGGITSAVGTIANVLDRKYQAELVPDMAKGNANSSDLNIAYRRFFTVKCMSIKYEYAKIIDDYLTVYGYAVNSLKVPNQTCRRYWNYVQIAGGESIGFTGDTISIPTTSMDIINAAYQSGVTIWHNHDNIGNYNLNNTIV